jgi:hypothetical protein
LWWTYLPDPRFQDRWDDYRLVLVLRAESDHMEVLPATAAPPPPHLADGFLHLPVLYWRPILTEDAWLGLTLVSTHPEHCDQLAGDCVPEIWEDLRHRYAAGRLSGSHRSGPTLN